MNITIAKRLRHLSAILKQLYNLMSGVPIHVERYKRVHIFLHASDIVAKLGTMYIRCGLVG